MGPCKLGRHFERARELEGVLQSVAAATLPMCTFGAERFARADLGCMLHLCEMILAVSDAPGVCFWTWCRSLYA